MDKSEKILMMLVLITIGLMFCFKLLSYPSDLAAIVGILGILIIIYLTIKQIKRL